MRGKRREETEAKRKREHRETKHRLREREDTNLMNLMLLQWYINTWGVKRREWRRSAQCITMYDMKATFF